MPRPFYDKEFEFVQPDGAKINLKGWGNQYFAVFETLDGYTVVKNPSTGFYEYAKLSADGSYLEPTGLVVGEADPAAAGIPKHIRISKAAASETARAAASRMTGMARWQERIQEERDSKRMMMASNGLIAAPPRRETKGDYVGLCILIQFPDVPGTISSSEVERFCNEKGYSGYGNAGSVNDYYFDVSGGRVNYTNVVVPYYYTAKKNIAYYADPSIRWGVRARELITEALLYLKSKVFDFSPLTADSKGYVYALNVFYAGPTVNNWSEGLWPHCSYLAQPFDIGGGKKLYDYQITNMGNKLTLGTFCHENGHMVCSFPDLYDYGKSGITSFGVGNYCLMAYGGDDKNPVQVSAYLKYKAGWADKATSLEAGIHTARAGKNEFFKIAKSPVEYYIIEARNRDKRDRSLPSAGLAIWHVDELGNNDYEDMTPQKHFECSLIQADGQYHLERGINAGDARDLFNRNNGPSFGNSTIPSSRWWDGTSSTLEITDIEDKGQEVSFKFGSVGKVFKKSSHPAKAIPDNDATGIQDKIVFDADGIVSSIKVDIDISHTFRGDLVVTLISPSGAQAVLHNKKGGAGDDLKTTFDTSSAPGLGNLIGQTLKGEWSILVQDLSAWDVGTLNGWGLEIEAGANAGEIKVEDEGSQQIPDNDEAGIVRSLEVSSPGKVKNIEVSVDITHTYIGDLKVTLESPQGTRICLHNMFGAGQDNLMQTYNVDNTPELASLFGEAIEGRWSIRIADLWEQDTGKLNRWSLRIIPE